MCACTHACYTRAFSVRSFIAVLLRSPCGVTRSTRSCPPHQAVAKSLRFGGSQGCIVVVPKPSLTPRALEEAALQRSTSSSSVSGGENSPPQQDHHQRPGGRGRSAKIAPMPSPAGGANTSTSTTTTSSATTSAGGSVIGLEFSPRAMRAITGFQQRVRGFLFASWLVGWLVGWFVWRVRTVIGLT